MDVKRRREKWVEISLFEEIIQVSTVKDKKNKPLSSNVFVYKPQKNKPFFYITTLANDNSKEKVLRNFKSELTNLKIQLLCLQKKFLELPY